MVKKYLPPYKPWLIPAATSMGFVVGVMALSRIFRQQALFKCLKVDYYKHLFVLTPLSSLDNLDAVVVYGSNIIYWGMEILLLMALSSSTHRDKTKREFISNFCLFIAAGFLIHYFIMIFATWSLAIYEGYHPMQDTIFQMNHGPWHRISHLKTLIIWELAGVFISVFFSLCAFIFRFSAQALVAIVLGILLFHFHLHTHVWLID